MSKADKILDDELDPEDLDPTPRGGKGGRDTEPKKTSRFLQRLGERVGFAGVVAFTVGAALLGSVSACKKCPSTPPPVRASCDEPASWCHRGDAAEAVQR